MSRIYRVDPLKAQEAARLISANTPAQALKHVVSELFAVEVATQADLVELIGKGVKVEDAQGGGGGTEVPSGTGKATSTGH